MKRSRGSILVLALWALMMLTIFAVSLGFGVRQRAALMNRLTTLDAIYPIAYSGVEYAKSSLMDDRNTDVDTLSDPWATVPPRVDLWNGYFSIGSEGRPGLVDEERKINLNFTNAEILQRLFQITSGLDRAKAEELVYCVLDWMDSDSFFGHAQYGAEGSYYENLKDPYTAKNSPYELMEELLLVKGMTPRIYDQIRPYVTVFGSGQVNLNTAPGPVLSALGFSVPAVEAILKYRQGSDGVEGNGDDNYFTNAMTLATDLKERSEAPLDQSQEVVLEGLLAASRLGVSSTVFSVHSRGVYEKNGASMDIDAVVDRQGRLRYCRASEVKLNGRN